jgi:hypothetical protein
MKKGLAMFLVLGVLAQEGWTISAAPAIGGAVGGAIGAIASKKKMECNSSGSKGVNREECQRQNREKHKDFQREGEERRKH